MYYNSTTSYGSLAFGSPFETTATNTAVALNTVTPKQSLLCKAMPCEIKAAAIRNKTVDDMKANDLSMVCYRYLQSRQGQKSTRAEAATFSALTAANIVLGAIGGTVFSFLIGGLTAPHVPPNIGNTGRYRKTKRACKDMMKNQLDANTIAQIQNLKYSNEGLRTLKQIMTSKGVDTRNLDYKMTKNINGGIFDC